MCGKGHPEAGARRRTYSISTPGHWLNLQDDYQSGYPLRIEDIQTGPGGTAAVQNLAYDWDGVGNLKWRKDDNQNLTEAFVYDNLHRLTSSTRNGTSNLTVSYNALGNLSSKSGVGTYTYHATKKHAVVSTSGGGSYGYDANGNMTSRNGSTIGWTSYNLPSVVNGSGSNQSQFFYTPDRARYKQVANYAGTVLVNESFTSFGERRGSNWAALRGSITPRWSWTAGSPRRSPELRDTYSA